SPKDFTFDEMRSLFALHGFEISNKGATSGSRIEFYNKEKGLSYIMHKPHPGNIIKGYVMKQVNIFLKVNGFIK
ncbi:MAG: type II toxin-antitoxin system HicA family toxin, partial [Prevotella sp.]|nr:type II toxin-antitoxin system HicA family toxin [Candidatus Prevotella equi]